MLSIAAAALLLLTVSGCLEYHGPPPTDTQLVGSWVHGETRLKLEADHTFTLENAPSYVRDIFGQGWLNEPEDSWDDAGEWRTDELGLHIGESVLSVDFVGSEATLGFALAVDSDDLRCFELVRQGSSLEPRGPENCFWGS